MRFLPFFPLQIDDPFPSSSYTRKQSPPKKTKREVLWSVSSWCVPSVDPFHHRITSCRRRVYEVGLGFICRRGVSAESLAKIAAVEAAAAAPLCFVMLTYLSLATGELDVHETAGVLEPLHGTALTVVSSQHLRRLL